MPEQGWLANFESLETHMKTEKTSSGKRGKMYRRLKYERKKNLLKPVEK